MHFGALCTLEQNYKINLRLRFKSAEQQRGGEGDRVQRARRLMESTSKVKIETQ